MLSDGTLTGTAGYGSRDGPRPRTLDPAAAPPPAGKRGGRPRHAGPDSRLGSLRYHRRPDLTVAPVGRGRHLRLPERLFVLAQPASRHRWPACRARQHPLGPQTAPACHDNAVLPCIRHYGSYRRRAGGCARRPENGPRDARSGARAPPIRVPRQGRDLPGRPGPVTTRRPRREHAFRRLASVAGKRLGGDAGASNDPPARRRTPTACPRGGDTRPAQSGNRRPAAQQLPAVTAHAW